MTIFVTTKADLVAAVNTATGQSFVEADLLFGSPRTPTSAELTQFGKNTAVNVKAVDGSLKASGFTTVFYDRLQLQPLENFNLTNCQCATDVPLATWLPILVGYINVPITIDHLVEHASSTVLGKVIVQLEATSNSLGWLGSATLKFGGYPDIATAFNGNTLIGF